MGPNAIALRGHTRDLDPIIVTLDPTTAIPVPSDTWVDHDAAGDALFYRDKTSPRRNSATRKMLARLIESSPVISNAVKAHAHVH
jgi:hypothetical protein